MNFNAKEFLQSLFGMKTSEVLPPEWVEEYEERAAILEYDGGLTRDQADIQALTEIQQRTRCNQRKEANDD